MQINLLKKIVEHTAGLPAVKIVDLLHEKKDVNEFLIAKKLKLTINQTRNLLYRLSHMGIISSIRKKDKRKGWYIYFWTLNVLKSLEVLQELISGEINALKTEFVRKQSMRFYKCKICGREVTEEAALLTDLTCSECGEVYSLADNTPLIAEINKNIAKLEKDLASVRAEIGEEESKIGQKLQKNIKKALKEKLKIKKLKRNAAKRLKNKLAGGIKKPKISKKKKM